MWPMSGKALLQPARWRKDCDGVTQVRSSYYRHGIMAGLVMAAIMTGVSSVALAIARFAVGADWLVIEMLAISLIACTFVAAGASGIAIAHLSKSYSRLQGIFGDFSKFNDENGLSPEISPRRGSSLWSQISSSEAQLRVAQRTMRSIAVEREQAQAQLTQLTGERAEFFSRLSHELRSPLNAILGYASILSEETARSGQKHLLSDLRRIKQAGTELLGLIDHLMAAGDDKTGKTVVDRVPFDLGSALANLVQNMEYKGMNVELPPRYQSGPTVYGNREKVIRAINSLIDHAFREHPGAHLDISSELRAGASAEVHVNLDFDVCETPIEARKTGTMLRELADTLARNVGGQLICDLNEDDRQRFTLVFPVDSRATKVTAMQKDIQSAKDAGRKGQRFSRTALAIDDDPSAIDLLERWLRRSGYEALSATDAETGLALAKKHNPDIILLDALMPGKTGYDLLPEMRQIPALRLTPIVMVTVDDDRIRGLEAGASDFVRKPVNEAAVRELLKVYEVPCEGDILIIDDDDDAAELLDRNVRRLGFGTRRATNGEEGLAAVREKRPSAILLDLNMPKLNGFEFIDAIASNTELAAIPMLVVSGEDLSLPQHHKLVQAGCRFYLKGNAAPREIAEGLREAVG